MLNALSIRKVLGLLILVCAPALAIIPSDIDLKLVGAQQVSNFEYQVAAGDAVSLKITTKPGALIFAFASSLDDGGSVVIPLITEKASALGELHVDLTVPKGLTGVFQVEAVGLGPEGGEIHSSILWVEVLGDSPKSAE